MSHCAEYDYTIRCAEDGLRLKVEVKSARLSWDKGVRRWSVNFQGVKLDQLDVLVLGVLLPSGAQLWEYDCSQARYLYGTGKKEDSTGKKVQISGSLNTTDILASWGMHIRPKLATTAALQAEFTWNDTVWNSPLLTHPSRADLEYCFKSDPFRSMCATLRAACFERLS
eukprot:2430499-Amphidinium_carterae.1